MTIIEHVRGNQGSKNCAVVIFDQEILFQTQLLEHKDLVGVDRDGQKVASFFEEGVRDNDIGASTTNYSPCGLGS